MESFNGYFKFELFDLQGMNTIGFVVEEENEGVFSLSKIDTIESEEEGKVKKTFNVTPKSYDHNHLIVLLTLSNGKAIISTGELSKDGFKKTETDIPLSYGTIYNTDGVEYKEVAYNPSLKRNFCIIDTQTSEEVKPNISIDPETNQMKSSVKIMPHRTYIVLEINKEQGE